MVVWNRPRGIRSQGCCFVSPRWGISTKRVLNANGRHSSTRLFALLAKAQQKWWYETDLVEFDPKGVFLFRPDGETRQNEFLTQLDDLGQTGVLRCLENPTQNGGMKPTSWNSIPRVFFRFTSMGKVQKLSFERNWTTFVNPAFCAAGKSLPKMVVSNRPRGIRSKGCFFVSPIWGNSKKRVFNAIGRFSSTRRFPLLGKALPKWWYDNELVEFDPRVFFRFAPMGKVEKTSFERNWTTFVNPAFFAASKSSPKMVVWNRSRGIRSQGYFFPFATMGKVEKTCFEHYWRDFVNLAFCNACKSPTKIVIWNRPGGIRSQGCFFDSPDVESRINEFWTQSDDLRQPGSFRCLGKPTKNGGMKPKLVNSIPRVILRFAVMAKVEKRVLNAIGRPSSTRRFSLLGKAHPKWWYETSLVEFDPKGVFSFRNDGESRKNEFSTQLDDLRKPGFLRCLQKPGKNGGIKPKLVNSIPRVILRFAVMGKVEKTSFERNWTTFVNPAFYAACKSPPKMVVWNLPRGIRSQGCFFVSPRWGNSKKRVLNAIVRPSSTRLFALLAKAHPKWWYEIEIGKIDSKGVSAFRYDGESRKNSFWTHLDDLRQPGFLRCLEKPTQNGGIKPKLVNSIPRLFFRFAPMGKFKKTRFERNWTTFVNPAFSAASKSPPKMVAWNRNCKSRSQGCFFASPRWGKLKKRVLNGIRRPSLPQRFALLGKAHPKWWHETEILKFDPKAVFSFPPDGEI